MTLPGQTSLKWPPIIDRAAEIVNSYNIPVTLRQVFYRLVAAQVIPNKPGAYNVLSRLSAAGRREGTFPPLAEHGRRLEVAQSWAGPADALDYIKSHYRTDRTEGQEYTLILGVEKNALGGLLWDWFADLGVPVVALGGVASETIERSVIRYVEGRRRPAVFIYAGDFDPTGTNMDRVFVEHTNCWEDWQRIALNEDQIAEMSLPVNAGKAGDPNTKRFMAAHPDINASAALAKGVPVQVELDAIEPLTLRSLYQNQIDVYWDDDAYREALEQERQGREALSSLSIAS